MSRICGTISRVFLPRGYAFIIGDDEREYFLHVDQFIGVWEGKVVHEGARVSFEPKRDGRGGNKLRANEVRTSETGKRA